MQNGNYFFIASNLPNSWSLLYEVTKFWLRQVRQLSFHWHLDSVRFAETAALTGTQCTALHFGPCETPLPTRAPHAASVISRSIHRTPETRWPRCVTGPVSSAVTTLPPNTRPHDG